MKKMNTTKRVKTLFTITAVFFILTACTSSLRRNNDDSIEETISAQSTHIAHLATQAAKQEQINWDQWEDIGRLYTQMPYALGIITPIPSGVTINRTPTPNSINMQEFGETTTPTPTMSIDIEYPIDTRTGIDEIDKVIDAILDVGIDARLELIHLTRTACTTADGFGGPPKCEPGQSDGTIVDVFPVSSGEGHYLRPDQLRHALGFTVRGIVAVFVVPEDAHRAEFWPAGTYGVIFSSEAGGHPHIITVFVENGRIIRLDFSPVWPPFDLIQQMSDEFIIAPIR